MRHAFTVDLEDWYQGIPIAGADKARAVRRLEVGTDRLLELLDASGTRATFFCLASVAAEYPGLLRRIADGGHEIGSHGLSHDLLYTMSPERFRDETRASIRALEDCIGRPVQAYRAAYFSITKRSLWALDVLAAEGVRYDSSIFPVKNWRYGIPDYPRTPQRVETANGPILELPISTRIVVGHKIPTTGGAYFRIYPYALTRANIAAAEHEGLPVNFYLHPWELDPDHPFVRFKPQALVTHYWRLGSTEPKLRRLLSEFRFTTLGKVLEDAFPGLSQ